MRLIHLSPRIHELFLVCLSARVANLGSKNIVSDFQKFTFYKTLNFSLIVFTLVCSSVLDNNTNLIKKSVNYLIRKEKLYTIKMQKYD
jgi:hypothetical protein